MRVNRSSRILLAIAAGTLALSSASAVSQAAGPEGKRDRVHFMLKHYDADSDGQISLQEFQAGGDALFAKLDADNDGRLSTEELAAAGGHWGRPGHDQRSEQTRPHRGFARMDADGDGFVTRAEFDAARMARFSALDADGNGVIDAEELPHGKGGRPGYGKRSK